MRPCPVCESPVSGSTCEVCGRELGAVPGAAMPVAPLEGLELTELPGLPPKEMVLGPEVELEPTLLAAVPDVPTELLPGWEAGGLLAAPDVPAGGMPDVDLGRETAVDAPTVVPVAATCRYCRNVQASGLFCDRCGMRLPWPMASSEVAPTAPVERVTCPRCFERTPTDRPRCGACGALLPTEG